MEKGHQSKQIETSTVSAVPSLGSKVYVCFLPSDISESEVRMMFQKFGIIIIFRLLKRKDGFTYSYIIYQTIEQAQKAINEMNKMKIQDKTLKVSFAVDNCQPKSKKLQKLKEIKKLSTNCDNQQVQPKLSKNQKKKQQKNNKKLRKVQEKQKNNQKQTDKPYSIIQVNKSQEETKIDNIKNRLTLSIEEHNALLSWLKQKNEETSSVKTQTEWQEQFDPSDLKRKSNKRTL